MKASHKKLVIFALASLLVVASICLAVLLFLKFNKPTPNPEDPTIQHNIDLFELSESVSGMSRDEAEQYLSEKIQSTDGYEKNSAMIVYGEMLCGSSDYRASIDYLEKLNPENFSEAQKDKYHYTLFLAYYNLNDFANAAKHESLMSAQPEGGGA